VLTAHLYHLPPPLRSTPEGARLSDGIEAVVLKALAKRRDGRYQSMAALRVTRDEVPIALAQAEPVTSAIRVGRTGHTDPPVAVPPATAEKRTVPSGRMTPPKAVPVAAPNDIEPETITVQTSGDVAGVGGMQ